MRAPRGGLQKRRNRSTRSRAACWAAQQTHRAHLHLALEGAALRAFPLLRAPALRRVGAPVLAPAQPHHGRQGAPQQRPSRPRARRRQRAYAGGRVRVCAGAGAPGPGPPPQLLGCAAQQQREDEPAPRVFKKSPSARTMQHAGPARGTTPPKVDRRGLASGDGALALPAACGPRRTAAPLPLLARLHELRSVYPRTRRTQLFPQGGEEVAG